MRICLTLGAKKRLSSVLEREVVENPDAVFRIWESTSGRYDEAKIKLGLVIDEAGEDDELAFCCGLPFAASRDFLSCRGEPHVFCIYMDENGLPGVYAL